MSYKLTIFTYVSTIVKVFDTIENAIEELSEYNSEDYIQAIVTVGESLIFIYSNGRIQYNDTGLKRTDIETYGLN